jgi:hypothetical protein
MKSAAAVDPKAFVTNDVGLVGDLVRVPTALELTADQPNLKRKEG